MSSTMSVNDVNRILYDYRHGSGAYNQQTNSMYNYFVNSTTSYSNSFRGTTSSTSYTTSTCNTPYNSNGYYYSSSIIS